MIAWFARNGVAANLLMVTILGLGLWGARTLPLEGFPEFDPDVISVQMSYRGATPSESEESIVLKIEEAIGDLEGIQRMEASAGENGATVTIEVEKGYGPRDLLDDIKNRVDAINTFPEETEKPVISLVQRKRPVIRVMVFGELGTRELRAAGERVRDELLALPEITQVDLTGVPPYEVAIEVSEKTLENFGLTIEDVAAAVRRSSVNLPAGGIRTPGGEVLLRTEGQAYAGEQFERIVLRTSEDGTRLLLGDIGAVVDGFEQDSIVAEFRGKPTAMVEVSRVGDQSAIDISDAVREYVESAGRRLPAGVSLATTFDQSSMVKARLNTLLGSAMFGGIIVFLLLAMFLRLRIALWVCIGIPVAFMGAFILMPVLGVTINVISLFAFILMLGIVVDDAIVTGESIYVHLKRERDATEAAIRGTHEIMIPVTFGVLTTVAAFAPLLFIEGFRGKLWAIIPSVAIPILLFSLIESKLILPAHLKHSKLGQTEPVFLPRRLRFLLRIQPAVARGLERFVELIFTPFLERCLRHRYLTLACFLSAGFLIIGLIGGGKVGWQYFPKVPRETVAARLEMPLGTPYAVTEAAVRKIEAATKELQKRYLNPDGEPEIRDIITVVGASSLRSSGRSGASHLGEVVFEVEGPDTRTSGFEVFPLVNEWRQLIGPIEGARELAFSAQFGRPGEPVEVRLRGQNFDELREVAEKTRAHLAGYEGLFDIRDTFENGKRELRLKIKAAAEQVGLTNAALARQVRQAFYGAEAQRIQRGRDDVRVMVRYPEEERSTLASLDDMRIRTPDGSGVPFSDVAEVERGRAFSRIQRIDRRRTVEVLADAKKDEVDLPGIAVTLTAFLDELLLDYPGVDYELGGDIEEQREAFGSLLLGIAVVGFVIYSLLAIPFRSYIQPLIVIVVIPFSMIGAVLGHMIMGDALSIMSVFGMLALGGVAVNDSLVLVDYINRKRREGVELFDAVRAAGARRFRPILLTSLTTFFGLVPLIFETSTQAQFLIPMAISLGFGILFATFTTLLLVPVNYLVLEDLKRLFAPYWRWQTGRGQAAPAPDSHSAGSSA